VCVWVYGEVRGCVCVNGYVGGGVGRCGWGVWVGVGGVCGCV